MADSDNMLHMLHDEDKAIIAQITLEELAKFDDASLEIAKLDVELAAARGVEDSQEIQAISERRDALQQYLDAKKKEARAERLKEWCVLFITLACACFVYSLVFHIRW